MDWLFNLVLYYQENGQIDMFKSFLAFCGFTFILLIFLEMFNLFKSGFRSVK